MIFIGVASFLVAYTFAANVTVDADVEGRLRNPSCSCGSSTENRIVGGVVTKPNEFPLAALLVTRNEMFPFCGGSILTPFIVVTAAHCTDDFVRQGTKICALIGEHDYAQNSETPATRLHHVARIVQHSGYNSNNLKNDISLLVMEKKIEFNERVGPVCLPPRGLNLDNQQVLAIGWGKVSQIGGPSSSLRKVVLDVLPFARCRAAWNILHPDNSQLCTLTRGKGFCQGDSGGPVIWLDPETKRWTLVGLPSYVAQCADQNPGVSTRVSSFVDWIQTNIRAAGTGIQACTAY